MNLVNIILVYYKNRINVVFSAAPHLCQGWIKHNVIYEAVDQWRPRMRTGVCDKGQHFEQLLNWVVASCWILHLEISRNFCYTFRRIFYCVCETLK